MSMVGGGAVQCVMCVVRVLNWMGMDDWNGEVAGLIDRCKDSGLVSKQAK